MTLSERIHAAAKPYLDGTWHYGHANRTAYPWPRGVRGPAVAAVAADREVDCCGLTSAVLMRAYPDAGWTQEDLRDLNIHDPRVPSSPIDAALSRGVGSLAADFAPETWALVQGWRRLPGHRDGASGHAIIVYSRGTGVLDALESTSREGNKGPRWRTTTAAKLRAEFPAALFIARLVE